MFHKISHLEKLQSSKIEELVICGMGGSGLPGEILNTFKTELGITVKIIIWKDYDLPRDEAQSAKRKAQNTLYTFVSFSGDTEETINGLKAALKIKNAKILVITGGGKLRKLAEECNTPLVILSTNSTTPREAAAKMFSELAKALNYIGVVSKVPAIPRRTTDKRTANIVRFIDKGVPIIYTSSQLKSLAYIWKIWLNETAKTPVFTNVLPELDHNEIVAFERRHPFLRAIFIEDAADSERIKTRITLTAKLIKNLGGKAKIVKLRGKSKLERFWHGAYLAEDIAKKLAIKNKVDPKLTKSIEILKTWLKK
jgi:glucose/mannose-6-phosphate isomerase